MEREGFSPWTNITGSRSLCTATNGPARTEGSPIQSLATPTSGIQLFAANLLRTSRRILPGIFLAAGITALAIVAADIETGLLGYALLEPLVLALLLGLAVRLA